MQKTFQIIFLLIITSFTYSQSKFDISVNEVTSDLAKKLLSKNKSKIVVLYITDLNKKQSTTGKYIADLISVDIVNNAGNFEVFDRENLSGIAEAKKLIAEGYIDIDKAKELGKILSVEAIIIGNYTVLSNTLKLTLKAFDSNTGLIIAASMNDLPLDSDAGALLGINVESNSNKNSSSRGFNNHSVNSNEDYNNPETVNKDCESQNTGDYCFTNKTSRQLRVALNTWGTGIFYNKEVTLEPGETQCFYNLKVIAYDYTIQQIQPPTGIIIERTSSARRGQILVERCKSKTFVIK
jgi:hypothetical protein